MITKHWQPKRRGDIAEKFRDLIAGVIWSLVGMAGCAALGPSLRTAVIVTVVAAAGGVFF